MSISVAMASYNGEKYIKEQLLSIINQLSDDDEIIISDDNSSDLTREIITQLALSDNRIKLIDGPCDGLIRNFENAILKCKNEYIFLSDQDDIWDNYKVKTVLSEFNRTNSDLILHNARILYDDTKDCSEFFFEKRGSKKGVLNNILKNSYIGCCMAFRSSLKAVILPFPENIPMHDQWIGLLAEKRGRVTFLDEPLISYRRHSDNASSETPSSMLTRINWRMNLIYNLILRDKRDRNGGKNE